ncbi:cell envelope integrity EipB family protein [Granulibacter bethesdensis]|nr:cell envelope integrity EipB family protein [Granulibacter bethesdensis]
MARIRDFLLLSRIHAAQEGAPVLKAQPVNGFSMALVGLILGGGISLAAIQPAFAASAGGGEEKSSSHSIVQTAQAASAITPTEHPTQAQIFKIASGMAAHRIHYDLTLDGTPTGDVIGARGGMDYEVIDACDGWATRQRLEMTISNRDGQDIQMVSDYTTWESKDGTHMRFHMRQTTDTAVSQETAGEASMNGFGQSGTIRYDLPRPMTKPIRAGTFFPMMHTAALLAAAENGIKFSALPLFDGTSADGVQDTFVVALDWKKSVPVEINLLKDMPSAKVLVSFFDTDKARIEPAYQAGMRYWLNGVADDLTMNFGDFKLKGSIASFKSLPHKC